MPKVDSWLTFCFISFFVLLQIPSLNRLHEIRQSLFKHMSTSEEATNGHIVSVGILTSNLLTVRTCILCLDLST